MTKLTAEKAPVWAYFIQDLEDSDKALCQVTSVDLNVSYAFLTLFICIYIILV